MSKEVLVVGGAGYVGTILSKYLLNKGYRLTCIDNFLYNHDFSIKDLENETHFQFYNIDLADTEKIKEIIIRFSNVIFLASVVGDPITKKYPEISIKINEDYTKNFINTCIAYNIEKFIYISTCSNYGMIPNDITADENYKLKPISLYAKSKVNIEKYLISLKENKLFIPVILRFATAFGVSSRMRFDLTISEFIKTIYDKRKLVVYDENTWRPYCHLLDFSSLIYKVLEADKRIVSHEIFNAGSDNNNYTKKMIIEKILSYLPDGEVIFSSNSSDPRNYKVNFNKVNKILNFNAKYDLDYGIKELISYLDQNNEYINSQNSNIYGNYVINYNYD